MAKEEEGLKITVPIGIAGTMAPYQEFFEQGVGNETLGSRMLGTLTQGKLFEAPSSGFGQEFAAENIPILQDMDPISRGVYNAVAPYGEKAFDILDTAYRLGGAAVADIAQLAGVDEDDVNEIQAAVNTAIGLFIPKGNPLITSQATNQAVQSVLKGVNAVRNDPLVKVMSGGADSGFRLSASGGNLDAARKEIVKKLNKFFKDKEIDELTGEELDANVVNNIFTDAFKKYDIKRAGPINPDTEYQRLYQVGLIDDELLTKITGYGNRLKLRKRVTDAEKAAERKANLALDLLKESEATNINKPFLYDILANQYPDIFDPNVFVTSKRKTINKMIEQKPALKDYLGTKRKIDPETLASIDDKDSDLFRTYFNKNSTIQNILETNTGLNNQIVFKYLDFIRKSSPSSKKPKGTDFDDFIVSYGNEINDLKNKNSFFYKNYKLFEEYENLRVNVQADVKPLLDKIFRAPKKRPNGTTRTEAQRVSEANNTVQIAHVFESSQIDETIGKTKMKIGTQDVSTLEGAGGLPQSYYLDLSKFNAIEQPKLEAKLRKAVDKGDQQAINELNTKLEKIGARVTIDGKQYGRHKFLNEKLNEIENKVINLTTKEFDKNNKYGITRKEYEDYKAGIKKLESAVDDFQQEGYSVNIFKDGGIVSIFEMTKPLNAQR